MTNPAAVPTPDPAATLGLASAQDGDGIAVWLLKRRHEDLGTMFRACWDNYIKFYTVFLTFNIVGMGWFVTSTGKDTLPKDMSHVIAVVFIAHGVMSSITSGSIAIYSRKLAVELKGVENSLLGAAHTPAALVESTAVPTSLAVWAGWANCAGLIGLSYAWVYLGFFRG